MRSLKFLTLTAIFAILFASCDNTISGSGTHSSGGGFGNTTSDCECTVEFEGIAGVVVEVLDFEGECSEISAENLPAEWQDIEELGGTFSCTEQ